MTLSVKTTLRERYKQADLEAVALKFVHRRAKNYLLTFSDEGASLKNKITNGGLMGLDDVFVIKHDSFNEFIKRISSITYTIAGKVDIIDLILLIDK